MEEGKALFQDHNSSELRSREVQTLGRRSRGREIQRANFQSAAPMLERSPTKDQQFPRLNKT